MEEALKESEVKLLDILENKLNRARASMSFHEKLVRAYFNYAYNLAYDFTTARFNGYQKLQRRCVSKLKFRDDDKVLCVGLGTGNEVLPILQRNRDVKIVGVDYSKTALRKAYNKALVWGKEIEVLIMDARRLEFTARSFDEVLCLHVMDFIEDKRQVTEEVLRVLKDGGRFVITYPSGKEDLELGLNLLKDSITHKVNSGKHWGRALFESLVQLVMGIVYLPLLLRSKKRPYSRGELEAMFIGLTTQHFKIEEDPVYHDFIVYGRK